MADYENRIKSLMQSPEQRRKVTRILYEESNEIRTEFRDVMVTRNLLQYMVSLDRRKMQEVECTINMDGSIRANIKLLEFVFTSGNNKLLEEFLMSFIKTNQKNLLRKLFNKMNSPAHGEMSTSWRHGGSQSNHVQQARHDIETSSTTSQATSQIMDVQEISATSPVDESLAGDMTPEARLRQLECDIIYLHGSLDDFARRVSEKRQIERQRVFHHET